MVSTNFKADDTVVFGSKKKPIRIKSCNKVVGQKGFRVISKIGDDLRQDILIS